MAVSIDLHLSREESQLWCSLPLGHKMTLLSVSGISDTGLYDFLEAADLIPLFLGLQKLIESLEQYRQ